MLISEPFRQRQIELHRRDPDYGSASLAYAPIVASLINRYGLEELLDYGAGKLRLIHALSGMVKHPMRMQVYEPASDDLELRLPPRPSQFVTCIDVLECVESECLEDVLDDLVRVTTQVGFFTIGTQFAKRRLSDGSNTHQTVQPPEWWLPKIMQRWDLQTFQKTVSGFAVTVTAFVEEELERVALTSDSPQLMITG